MPAYMDSFPLFSIFLYAMMFIITLMCSGRTLVVNAGILGLLFCGLFSVVDDPLEIFLVLVFVFHPVTSAGTGFLAGAFTRLLLLSKKGYMARPRVRGAIFWACLMFVPVMFYCFALSHS
ncbi:MAG: hypothetical protein WA071_16555 [Undibacterium umbellatum]